MQRDIKLGLVVGLVLLVLCGFFYMKMRATGSESGQTTGTDLEGILGTPEPEVTPSSLDTQLPKIVRGTESTEPDLGEFAAREKTPQPETPAPAVETQTPEEPAPNTVVTMQPATKAEDDKVEEAVKEDVREPVPPLPKIPEFPVRQPEKAEGAAARSPFAALGEREYEVQPGDTLSGIASEEMGSVKHWKKLFEANKDKLASPEKLVVGMTLIIPEITVQEKKPAPAPEPALVPPAAEEKADEVKEEEGDVHIVKKGETLSDIAGEYLGDRNKWKEIAKANPDMNPHRIRPGMKLRIPRDQ